MKALSKEELALEVPLSVPVLVRIWHEDDVWNVSAYDLPVVAYSTDFEEARSNFSEALRSHFEALEQLEMLQATARSLIDGAKERRFYDRIEPHQTFEKFVFNYDPNRMAPQHGRH